MSSQRVIQDSDDEDGDILSDVASSCDPLQDSSFAPKETGPIERVQKNHSALQAQAQFSANDLPQVDFDRFLRSESSIMAGDYEDERWVSTANSNPGNVIPFGNFHTEHMQLRDNSVRYTVNAPHNALSSLPPTSNADYDDTVAVELDHPSKRRKVSNTNTQDTLLKEPEETGSSYNFFASPDPNGPPQTATSLPPVPFTEENSGMPRDIETEPLPMGTPPPTIPFSEDPLPQEQCQGAIVAEATTVEYEAQETILKLPPSETNNEVLSTKKKRGRPKKQDPTDAADSGTKIISENATDGTEQQATKKKPGRPKKQETEIANEQPPAIDQKESMDEGYSTTTATKSSKKKVKRSKTTSDLPNNKASELKAEQDVIWVETNPINSATTDERTNTTAQTTAAEEIKVPKKRGRKKKEPVEEPAAAASSENQSVLQDISNIQQQSAQQEKQKDIDVEIDGEKQQALDTVDTFSHATNLPETPIVEIQNKQAAEGGEGGVATPTPQEKNKAIKQTPISSAGRVPLRVGLSRRARIAPLLKVVRK